MDTIKKYLSSNKEYLITLVNSKNAAQELLNTHSVNKYDSKYIIDVLNANYVMNGNLKNSSEELLLVLHNDGNIAQISSQSFEKVNVTATIEYDSEKNFLLETGLFEVYRYLDNKQIFHSQIQYDEYNIGKIIANYYLQSEQIKSAIVFGSLIGDNNLVLSSGALFVQLLPNHREETVKHLETSLSSLQEFSKMLALEQEQEILETFSEEFELLDEHPIFYKCRCSNEQMKSDILTISKSEIEKIIAEDGFLSVRCNYCGKLYEFYDDDFK